MFNNCVSFLEAPFVCRIMDDGTSKTTLCKLILNCSEVLMEKNCEFEWSCDNGGILHKCDKNTSRNFEPPGGRGAKIRKLIGYRKPSKLKQENFKGEEEPVKYGELIVLGFNGTLPQGDRGRKRSKFELYKRQQPNGVKRSVHYLVKTPHSSQAILDAEQHSVSYRFSKNQAVIVEYILDENTDMFQEKAPKWQENDGDADGLTTNGILIMHPRGSFCSGEIKCGYNWWETSVTGKILSQRESRSSQEKGQLLEGKTNILKDGTLIHLCGATLLWRSAESLAESPNKHDLSQHIDKIITMGPQCLVSPKSLISSEIAGNEIQQSYVYLNCGHVRGVYEWEQKEESETTKCFICSKLGPVVEVRLGLETAFYVDCGLSTFAFNPCGHMATEKTVKYWADIAVPYGSNSYYAICPFCASPLSGSPGYVQLILQDDVDRTDKLCC